MTINGLLDKLFRRHRQELLFFATQRAGGAAEDVVQEAYLRLLQHPDPASIENARAFLFRTTSNLSIDLYRRRLLEAGQPAEAGGDVDLDWTTPPVDVLVSQQQQLALFHAMLQTLPEIARHVFVLNRIEGLSHAEIGKRLRISPRGSERHLALALRHLLKHPDFAG